MLIDTHSHLYSDDYSDDREAVIARALSSDVGKIILPNIDSRSVTGLLTVAHDHPEVCFPLMGLHPSSVGEAYVAELDRIIGWFSRETFFGVGEIGIDLYWDKTRQRQQEDVFRQQLRLARTLRLPVVIHVRESFREVYAILEAEQEGSLTGVFHCFSGNGEEARMVIDAGFFLGIGGVVTFKNSSLPGVLEKAGPHRLVLETDSPWLSPAPHRGKRNEPGYLVHVADKVAAIFSVSSEEIAEITTANARSLFRI